MNGSRDSRTQSRGTCPDDATSSTPRPYPRGMRRQTTMVQRLAALVGGLCLVGALVAAFAPANGCGSWVAPAFTDDEITELAEGFDRLAEQTTGTARVDAISNRAETLAIGVYCHETLDDRRTWTIGLGLGALVIPAGLLWVTSGRRETTSTSTD